MASPARQGDDRPSRRQRPTALEARLAEFDPVQASDSTVVGLATERITVYLTYAQLEALGSCTWAVTSAKGERHANLADQALKECRRAAKRQIV